jgi:predicted GNAT family acetyltransferase
MTPRHEPEHQRFTLPTAPASVLDYSLSPGQVVFTHTGVPPALQGQGLAGQLVEAGLRWAQSQGMRVVPACTYVQSYIQRHPEWQNLVA